MTERWREGRNWKNKLIDELYDKHQLLLKLGQLPSDDTYKLPNEEEVFSELTEGDLAGMTHKINWLWNRAFGHRSLKQVREKMEQAQSQGE
jgi:hypothetical protein